MSSASNAEMLIFASAYARLNDVHQANRLHRAIYQRDKRDLENLYQWAMLFNEKYNTADAQRTFEEALAINANHADLLAGYAASFYSLQRQEELAKKALAVNPRHVDALNILASLQIVDINYDAAESHLEKALSVNPHHEVALGHQAAIYHFRNETDLFEKTEAKVLTINPECSRFYLTIAENCENRYRYKDVVRFCEIAIAKNDQNWNAYALIGSNLLRVGKPEAARRYLETGFKGDAFNVFARNTLELMDEFENFVTLESAHFRLMIHKSESDILGGRILAFSEECWDSLSAKYPYRPQGKISIEAYNDHDDFAVRVSGLPGVGLLGVCFGDYLALDTPKAQGGQDYNWAQTLWHEIAHVMAVGLSDHKVPRWFTEGLSVYEELKARPYWRRKMQLELYTALDHDRLLGFAEINQGFTRPQFPEQVIMTYYQSSRWIEFIAERYGFQAIVDLLIAFKNNSNLDEAFQSVLNIETAELEKYLFNKLRAERNQYDAVMQDLPPILSFQKEDESLLKFNESEDDNPFFTKLREGFRHLKAKNYVEAEAAFLAGIEMFPDYTQSPSPYEGLAAVYRDQQQTEKLQAILAQYLAIAEYGAAEARELAEMFNGSNKQKSIYYLNRSMEVDPYDIDAHLTLAALYREKQLFPEEAASRKAILSLNPIDRSDAYYQLALSLYHGGKTQEAKMDVLRALDLAPGYRDAQKLLLKCVDLNN